MVLTVAQAANFTIVMNDIYDQPARYTIQMDSLCVGNFTLVNKTGGTVFLLPFQDVGSADVILG
jgi:hypothetical protein